MLKPDELDELTFEQIKEVHGEGLEELTFDEIKELYGEEAAINVGIATDPDTFELDEEWFKEARPAREVDPGLFQDSSG